MINHKARTQFKKHVLDKFKIASYQDIHEAVALVSGGLLIGEKGLNKLKGDLFETFVQGMLMTDPLLRIKYAFKPGDDGPNDAMRLEAIKKLGIKDKDDGIDLVLIDKDNRVITVQDKFLRDTLAAVPYGEVTNFYTQSQLADIQYLVTSGSEIDGRKKDPKHGVMNRIKITFDDLKNLSEERINQIIDFIQTETYTKQQRKTPRPDQIRAIAKLRDGLEKNINIQYISACGTGKTFVSSRLTNDLISRDGEVVVFVPSINLMKQTIESWATEFSDRENYSFQAICSDETVSNGVRSKNGHDDAVDMSVEDLKCVTTTDVEEIRKFINRPHRKNELKVTFCTYQSSPRLSEALEGIAFKGFNLGILDEAHRTAINGDKNAVEDSAFTFPLSDDKISIRQRLSMTATPRVLKLKNRDDEDDSYTYSMDNEDIYGPVAHEYKFSEAVADKVIVPFKIVISAVLEEDIKRFQNARVQAGKFELNAKSAVAAVALKKAIEDTGARNVVTYQSRTKDAANLAKIMDEVMPDNWNTDFVDGKMPAKQRSQKVAILGQKDPAIITNSRVMTEGVDIPDIDMAAFIDNMTSGVDIVQITGRVMRTAVNKEVGYIVLPVAVNRKPGQTIEDAAEEADFSMIYRVINALSSEDEELMAVINEVRSARGSGDVSRQRAASEELRKRISFSFSGDKSTNDYLLTSEAIARVVETKVVDRISSPIWEKLNEFKLYLIKTNGEYPLIHSDERFADGSKIGVWINQIRNMYRLGKLREDLVSALNEVNFIWGIVDRSPKAYLKKVMEIRDILVDNAGIVSMEVRNATFSDGVKIGAWIDSQRVAYKRGKLSKEKIDLLNSINFVWDASNDNFFTRVEEIKNHLKEIGQTPPVSKISSSAAFADGTSMQGWFLRMRKMNNDGSLSMEKSDALNLIQKDVDDNFKMKIQQISTLLKQNGGALPRGMDNLRFYDGTNVGKWLGSYRARYKSGALSDDILLAFHEIGLELRASSELVYERKIKELVEFIEKNDGKYPSAESDAFFFDGTNMGKWVSAQRIAYSSGRLSPDKIQALEAINFNWCSKALLDSAFLSKVSELQEYVQRCGVFPSIKSDVKFSDGTRMGTWIGNQRMFRKKGMLSPERIEALNGIHFDWGINNPSILESSPDIPRLFPN